jgi:hypothetical protein
VVDQTDGAGQMIRQGPGYLSDRRRLSEKRCGNWWKLIDKGGSVVRRRVSGSNNEGARSQSKEVTRGPPELVQHFLLYRGSSHRRKGAACPKLLRFG